MHDQARIDHQLRDLRDAANVLDAVRVGEAEILVESVPHVVAVEQVRVTPQRIELRFSTRFAIVDLPAPDRPVNQTMHGFVS